MQNMEMIIIVISIICFITSFFWLIAKITGGPFAQFVGKTIGFFGTFLPFIYWLKLLQII